MTYGWMLLVVAIAGGAIFSIAQSQGVESTSGFTGGDVTVENFGLSQSNSLDMVLRNTASDTIEINEITLSQNGQEIVTDIEEDISVGDSSSVSTLGVVESDSANSVDVTVSYDAGGLTDLSVEGTVSGNLQVDPEGAAPNNNWVFVDVSQTPSSYMDTSGMGDFYLMKYEARDDGGTAVSEPGTSIYSNINQTQSQQKCQAIGADLVSDRQWNAVAHQAAVNPANWADGNVGSTIGSGGGLYSGNTGDSDSVSYDSSTDPATGTSNETKRTLELANGATVWDLSGNVWEWTDNSFRTEGGGYESPRLSAGDNVPSDGWRELNQISVWNGMPSSSASNSTWTGDEGIGRIYLNGDKTYGEGSLGNGENYNVSAVRRGGYWGDGRNAGVFSALLNDAPSNANGDIGFRCSLS